MIVVYGHFYAVVSASTSSTSTVTGHGGPSASVRVGILLVDGFALLSFASVSEPLRVANLLGGRELYSVRVLPAAGAEAVSSSGARVPADAQVGERVDFDMVLVVAAGDPFAFHDPRVAQWLRHLARRGIALGGISGGPVVLAEAGVMKGYRLTLHWQHAPALRARHPDLIIERSLYVIDRERLSCAGGTAPLDLMQALLIRQQGVALAREVADWLQQTEIRPPGGAQRAGVVARYNVHKAPLVEALAAMETHLTDPLSLEDLAQIAGVGARHLTRLFDAEFGSTPMRFYRRLRLEQGRALLRDTGLAVGDVGRAVGFASGAHFAAAFRTHFGTPPTAERSGRVDD